MLTVRKSLTAASSRGIVAAAEEAIRRNPETDVIYVHRDGEAGAVAVICPIEAWRSGRIPDGNYSHGHIAGDEDDA